MHRYARVVSIRAPVARSSPYADAPTLRLRDEHREAYASLRAPRVVESLRFREAHAIGPGEAVLESRFPRAPEEAIRASARRHVT